MLPSYCRRARGLTIYINGINGNYRKPDYDLLTDGIAEHAIVVVGHWCLAAFTQRIGIIDCLIVAILALGWR